jgi:murein DD-endopeptidase MepM/ murein hydrolase activator NlpD
LNPDQPPRLAATPPAPGDVPYWPAPGHYALTQADIGSHQGAGDFHARGGRHQGVDIEEPERAPVYAMSDGVVSRADARDPGYGLRVDLNHDQGLMSRSAHLSESLVKPGDRVRRGQVIGYSGRSGNASGVRYRIFISKPVRTANPLTHMGIFRTGNRRQNLRLKFLICSIFPS